MTEDTDLLHSLQRALVGAIGVNVVGVAAHRDQETLTIEAFVTGELPNDEREALEVALTEVLADLSAPLSGRLRVQSAKGTLLSSTGTWAYLRLGYTISRDSTESTEGELL